MDQNQKRVYMARRSRLKAYGRWEPFVDAEPARRHVRALGEYGIGWMRTAELADVPTSTVWKLLYGDSGRGAAPSQRIRPDTAAKILAVQPSLALAADGARIDGAGTRRRLQALVAAGWSVSQLAKQLGMQQPNLHKTLQSTRPVRAGTARRVSAVYRELWDQPPPAGDQWAAAAAARARNYARKRNWPLPADWDDDLLDLPEADLEADLARRVDLMDEPELRRCQTAYHRHGDRSPLIVAAAREWRRRLDTRRNPAA